VVFTCEWSVDLVDRKGGAEDTDAIRCGPWGLTFKRFDPPSAEAGCDLLRLIG